MIHGKPEFVAHGCQLDCFVRLADQAHLLLSVRWRVALVADSVLINFKRLEEPSQGRSTEIEVRLPDVLWKFRLVADPAARNTTIYPPVQFRKARQVALAVTEKG